MKFLKRKYARLMTILMVMAISLLIVMVVAYDVLNVESLFWAFLGVIGASACAISMIAVGAVFLRCPYCGQGMARSYWKSGEGHEQFCRKCGKQFFFDDEIKPE